MPLELLDLSPELLLEVIDRLRPADLSRVSRVSRALRRTCQPVLFRHLQQSGCPPGMPGPDDDDLDPDAKLSTDTAPPPGHAVRDLLRVLVQHPALGQAVQSLLLWTWQPPAAGPATEAASRADARIAELQAELWADVATADLLSPPRDPSAAERACRAACQDVILLWCFLPALETLVLDLPSLVATDFLTPLVRGARGAHRRPLLPALAVLEVDYPCDFLDWSMDALAGLLESPALTTFRGHWLSDQDGSPTGIRYTHAPCTTIAHLELLCSTCSSDGVCALFRTCTALRTFTLVYRVSGSADADVVCHLDFAAIADAVHAHRATLQALTLDISREEAWSTLDYTWGQIDLAACTQLGHVDLPAWAVTGPALHDAADDDDDIVCDCGASPPRSGPPHRPLAAVLPPSVKSLVVRNATTQVAHQLRDFCRDQKQFPELHDVRVVVSSDAPWSDADLADSKVGAPSNYQIVK